MIILMSKTIIIDATETQSTPRSKNNLILVKKTRSKHKWLSNKETKIIATSFRLGKTWLMLYLKNQNPNFKNTKCSWWWLSGNAKKIAIMF
ncbi:hypothetical protein [Spiroplasma poulsonii]|uniref:hypothetical protein n=1 Tax=Spiroplasma poulsonii TaxID=2138 RepID=UPI001F4C621D|nr:hypothetical protein [Spiroplasma poulsonii]UNF62627.1 hypothetical protein MNU24_04040 [Spiroplasma poulsonii]